MLAASCSTGTIKVRQSIRSNAHHGDLTRHDRYNTVKGTRSPWIHRHEKRQTIRRNSRRIDRQPPFPIVSPSPPRLRPSEVCQRGPRPLGRLGRAAARIEKPSGLPTLAAPRAKVRFGNFTFAGSILPNVRHPHIQIRQEAMVANWTERHPAVPQPARRSGGPRRVDWCPTQDVIVCRLAWEPCSVIVGGWKKPDFPIRSDGYPFNPSLICFSISRMAKKATPMATIRSPSASDTGAVPRII